MRSIPTVQVTPPLPLPYTGIMSGFLDSLLVPIYNPEWREVLTPQQPHPPQLPHPPPPLRSQAQTLDLESNRLTVKLLR